MEEWMDGTILFAWPQPVGRSSCNFYVICNNLQTFLRQRGDTPQLPPTNLDHHEWYDLWSLMLNTPPPPPRTVHVYLNKHQNLKFKFNCMFNSWRDSNK